VSKRSDDADRRAEAREKRRTSRSAPETGDNGDGAVGTALKGAAAAAAVGAVLGAARTISSRSEEEPEREQPEAGEPQEQQPDRPRGAAPSAVRTIVQRATEQLHELQGREPESVSAVERRPDGWCVTLEVVEVERIPSSTDVLASFAVELDDDGELLRYERVCRYHRSQADRS